MTAKEIVHASIRLPNDANGNPRYYVPVYLFRDESGRMFRPGCCSKYRGRQFGPGWVFQSYALESDIAHGIKYPAKGR